MEDDILKIVVKVPAGTRNTDEIKEKLIEVVGVEHVVYDHEHWDKVFHSMKKKPAF